MPKLLKKQPRIIMKDGSPDAVIIDINDYKKILQRLEDKEDIIELEKMRKGKLKFRKFDEFLAENDNAL